MTSKEEEEKEAIYDDDESSTKSEAAAAAAAAAARLDHPLWDRDSASPHHDGGSNIDETNGNQFPLPPSTTAVAESSSPVAAVFIGAQQQQRGQQHDDDDDHAPTRTTTPSSSSSSPPNPPTNICSCYLGWKQVCALIHKNLLVKYRTPMATLFEISSPLLMMIVLVAAYTLSEIEYAPSQFYTRLNVTFPLVSSWTGGGGNTAADQRWTFAGLDEALWEVQQVLQNPLYIPSLTEFIDLSDGVSSQLNASLSDENLLRLAEESSFGQSWGNLLTLGTLHLSPATVADAASTDATTGSSNISHNRTRDFAKYLLDTYPELIVIMDDDDNSNNTTAATKNDDGSSTNNGTTTTVVRVRMHPTEKDALAYINNNLQERTWALLHFDEDENENGNDSSSNSNNLMMFQYKIRMNYTTLPNTNLITNWVSIGLDTAYQRYYLSGYLTLQQTLNQFAFSSVSSQQQSNDDDDNNYYCGDTMPLDNEEIWSMPMPTAEYEQNSFFQAVGYLLGLAIAMAFLYPTSRLIKTMVEEKESRMKETLFILGVQPWAHWLSWLLSSLLMYLIIAVLVTWILTAQLLKFSSPSCIFALIGLFCTSTIGFSFFVAAFFSKAKLAAIIGPAALFATLLPRFIFFGSNRYEATVEKRWASLLPCTAFAFGADVVADYEYAEEGVHAYNASEGAYSFNTTLGFLLFDTLLYIVLGWYLDLVLPRQYGAARKWYFPLTPKYWIDLLLSCCCFPSARRRDEEVVDMSVAGGEHGENSDIEPVTDPFLKPRVRIKNLVKRYGRDKDVPPAVNNLNLVLYEDQITCLLGHNGSGKSSTIAVLTGLFPPTAGDCVIYGNSITGDIAKARRSMGICHQQNVVFDRLTVLEHLAFFQRIKGIRPSHHGLRDRAQEMGLSDYLHTSASALSGGNKRKLCCAIALCGDPNFVLLDEPTSGMDPASRRECWEVLRKKRAGRVTLLTSHFMDESEVLGDRIAIMREGVLQCCGSGLFLKKRFGIGYNLTVVLDADDRGANTLDMANDILLFLRAQISGTELVRTSAREMTFRFPQESDSLFPVMFEAFENNRETLKVGAYGISNSSLEEVFLRLAESESSAKASQPCQCEVSNGTTNGSNNNEVQTVVPKNALSSDYLSANTAPDPDRNADRGVAEAAPRNAVFSPMGMFGQITLLYYTRWTILKRDRNGACFTIILPVLLIALVLLILMVDIPRAGPAIEVSMDLYGTSPSGTSALTEVKVGGGASLDSAQAEIDSLFKNLSSVLQSSYPVAQFSFSQSLNSSQELSQYLLDTYNDHDHHERYGAFALSDIIKMDLAIDWDAIDSISGDSNNGLFAVAFLAQDSKLVSSVLTAVLAGDQPLNGTALYEVDVATTASILHNSSSPHAVAAFNQAYTEYLFKACWADPSSARLVSINHPLPLTDQQTIEIKFILSVLASLFLLIPLCYIPAAFVVFVVKERVCKSKHLKLVSGVDLTAYWISNYLFDLTLYLLLTFLVMMVFLMYGTESAIVFVGDTESFFCTMTLLVGYGLSGLPFAYLLSRRFDNHSSAQIAVMGLFFVTGFVAVMAYFIMSEIESTESVAEGLRPLFRLWPAYNVGDGLIALAAAFWEREILDEDKRPFDWDVAGKSVFLVYALTLPYTLWLMILEYSGDGGSGGVLGRMLRNARRSLESWSLRRHGVRESDDGTLLLDDGLEEENQRQPDADVVQESTYVTEHRSQLTKTNSVLIVNLWKIYPSSAGMCGKLLTCLKRLINYTCCSICRWQRQGHESGNGDTEEDESKAFLPKRAVRGLTTCITEGETFGLLGANGAGKTTTIGVLTGDIAATRGQAYVAGHDVTGRSPGGVHAARKHIGFCPQVDPLLDLMTGRETLTMFARLRGVPKHRMASVVKDLLAQLTLVPHADKTVQSYSGGNKRKLSLGVALIGNPSVLFVDEASSGLDPVARRHIWQLLERVSKERSVILTSHVMEEAEALCTRVGIMVNGQLSCLGSVQHLKTKYLDGYTLDIQCSVGTDDSEVDEIVRRITVDSFPGSQLVERHGRFLRFQVSSMSMLGLGTTFHQLQALKDDSDLRVENYSISQCSLESVFIKMVQAGHTNTSAENLPSTSFEI